MQDQTISPAKNETKPSDLFRQTVVIRKLTGCARCGGEHVDLCARPLSNPPSDEPRITHFTLCPRLLEPVLVHVSFNQSEVEQR